MTLATNADNWTNAADKAWKATTDATSSSQLASGYRNRPNRIARSAYNDAVSSHHQSYYRNNTPSDIYKGVLLHERAARLHQAASQHHFRMMTNTTDEGDYGRHAEASSLHSQASRAHLEAAQAAAGKLGIDYAIHAGLRQAIRQAQPNDTAPRLVYADFLEEHGLPKEARRLRLDPTGHISRAVRTYRRANGFIPVRELYGRLDHRRAIEASVQANTLQTKEAHERAARLHTRAASQAHTLEGNFLDNAHDMGDHDPDYNGQLAGARRYAAAANAYEEAAKHHSQQAKQLGGG